MKRSIKTLLLILTFSFLIFSFNSINKNQVTSQPEPDTRTETLLKFEAGNYNISWNNKYTFKTSLTKLDENTLSGNFCINNKIENCKVLGPITITRDGNNLIFKFFDNISRVSVDRPGEFDGSGTQTKDNEYSFLVNGEDGSGDNGTIRTYTNNRVILTKI